MGQLKNKLTHRTKRELSRYPWRGVRPPIDVNYYESSARPKRRGRPSLDNQLLHHGFYFICAVCVFEFVGHTSRHETDGGGPYLFDPGWLPVRLAIYAGLVVWYFLQRNFPIR